MTMSESAIWNIIVGCVMTSGLSTEMKKRVISFVREKESLKESEDS